MLLFETIVVFRFISLLVYFAWPEADFAAAAD